jgi:quercetin dioxygenase-like cupin family protein
MAEEIVEFVEEVAGIYFRSVLLPYPGDFAIQHVHDYDHATYIGSGSVSFWAGSKFQGYYRAGQALEVKAGIEHKFQAMERNTRLTCVHIGASAEAAREKELLCRGSA